MTKQEIIIKVKELGLPKGSYVVFGSCPLAAVGIREASDIDLMVSQEMFTELKKNGWVEVNKGSDNTPLVFDVFEAYSSWKFGSYNPSFENLFSSSTEVDSVHFASLQEVREWKVASGRPKDLIDIKLIDEYLEKQL
jgi:hypothetical protein